MLVVDVDDGDVDVGLAGKFGVADAAVEGGNFEKVAARPADGDVGIEDCPAID